MTILTILIIIVSLIMGIFVLIQNPKGGGLASGFTGANQIGGVQKTADFLEKGTWYMMVALFVLCIFSASYNPSSSFESGGSGADTEQPQPTPADPQ